MIAHEGQISQVPLEDPSFAKGSNEDPKGSGSGSSLVSVSFVEDSKAVHETHVDEPVEKEQYFEEFLDINSEDSASLDVMTSRVSVYDDRDIISNEPLFEFVEHLRHKKSHKAKNASRGKSSWSKCPKKVRHDSLSNVSGMGSKKGSFNVTSHSSQEEVSSSARKRNSILIKEARENMKLGVRLGIKYHGRESFNIKKMLKLEVSIFPNKLLKRKLKLLTLWRIMFLYPWSSNLLLAFCGVFLWWVFPGFWSGVVSGASELLVLLCWFYWSPLFGLFSL